MTDDDRLILACRIRRVVFDIIYVQDKLLNTSWLTDEESEQWLLVKLMLFTKAKNLEGNI